MPLDAPARTLPRAYLAWLSGSTVAHAGNAVLAFALAWAASDHGGTTAALVLTLSGAPRLVLLVVGGAVADRVGARHLLITGEAALLALTAVLAVALARFGTPAWLLLTASPVLGTVTALCLPATGSMPRRLVRDDQLTRALAVRQALNQSVLMTAAPVAGLLLGALALPVIAWVDVAALAVSLGVLIAVREIAGPEAPAAPADGERRLAVADGFRVAAGTPGLRRALLLTGAAAALMLPVPTLLVPLLGRAWDWGPGGTGTVAGAVGAGVILAALLASRRRPSSARVPSAAAGLAMSAAGACVLAGGPALGGSSGVALAATGGFVFGLGNGAFVARLAPFVLGSAPRTHLARVQALVGLVQLAPVLVTNTVLGALAEHTSPGWAVGVTAVGLAVCCSRARGVA